MTKTQPKSRFGPWTSVPPLSREAYYTTVLRNSRKRNREELRSSSLSANQSIKDLTDRNGDMKTILASITEQMSIASDRFGIFTAEVEYRRTTGEEKRKNREMKSAIEAVKALLSGYERPAHRVKLADCLEAEREVLELAMNANSINTLVDVVLPKLLGSDTDEIDEEGTSSKRPRSQ